MQQLLTNVTTCALLAAVSFSCDQAYAQQEQHPDNLR